MYLLKTLLLIYKFIFLSFLLFTIKNSPHHYSFIQQNSPHYHSSMRFYLLIYKYNTASSSTKSSSVRPYLLICKYNIESSNPQVFGLAYHKKLIQSLLPCAALSSHLHVWYKILKFIIILMYSLIYLFAGMIQNL